MVEGASANPRVSAQTARFARSAAVRLLTNRFLPARDSPVGFLRSRDALQFRQFEPALRCRGKACKYANRGDQVKKSASDDHG